MVRLQANTNDDIRHRHPVAVPLWGLPQVERDAETMIGPFQWTGGNTRLCCFTLQTAAIIVCHATARL